MTPESPPPPGRPARRPRPPLLPTLALVAMAGAGGCAYTEARLQDLRDVVRFGLELGPQFGVHVEATPLVHTGLGFGLVPGSTNSGLGLMGRRTPIRYHFRSFDLLVMHYRVMDGYPEDLCHFTHLLSSRTPSRRPRQYDPIDWLDLEVSVIAVAGARVGVNPGQAVDFLAGLFTLDPAGDDAPAEPPPPPEDAAATEPGPKPPATPHVR